MKKISVLLLLALLCSVRLTAQTFDWANVIQGFDGSAYAHQVVIDNNGDVIILGTFSDQIKLSGGPTPVVLSNPGHFSYFLAKYDPSGSLYWAKQFNTIGQPTFENQAGLTINDGNDIYVAAPFTSDITIEGTSYSVGGGGISSFIAKFDPDGNLFGGFPLELTGAAATVSARDIAVNSADEFFVLVNFNGNLNLGGGVSVSSIGSSDIFVAKYDNAGTPLFAIPIQSVEYDEGTAVELDGALGFYVSGVFRGPLTFPSVPSDINLTPNSNIDFDFFVAHYNGTFFDWAKQGTGAGSNVITDMFVNTTLNGVYVTGYYSGLMTVESAVTAVGGDDVFALRLDAISGSESWLATGGGSSADRSYGITQHAGTVHITGRFRSSASFGGFLLNTGFISINNVFIASLNESSGVFTDAFEVNSNDNGSIAFDIATDGTRNYVVGEYNNTLVATPERWSTSIRDFFVLSTNNSDLSVNALWGSYYYTLDISDSDTDDSGNTYLAGSIRGYYEEYLASSYITQGDDDVYIAIFDNSGSLLRFEFGGGPGRDVAEAIVVNKVTNEVYLTGTFETAMSIAGSNFIGGSSSNAFLAKYDITGSIWGIHAVNSTGLITVNDLATDPVGNVVITGNKGTAAATFGLTLPIASVTPDYYVAMFNINGIEQWVKTAQVKSGNAVTMDSNGDIVVAGLFDFATTFEGQTITPTTINEDVFVAKYASDGTFQWIRTGGGNEDENVFDVKTDQNNAIYVTGWFFDTADFDVESLTGLNDDVFLIKYDPFGNIQWARSGGGATRDAPSKLVIDGSDNVILTGITIGNAAFDCFVYSGLQMDDREILITKYNSSGDLLFGTHFGFASNCDECNNADLPFGIGIDASGNFYLSGRLSGPTTLGSLNLALQPLTTNYFFTRFTLPVGVACPAVVKIINIIPGPNTTGIPFDANIEVEFDKDILMGSVNSTTLIVRGERSGLLPGSYAAGGTFAIFDPYTGFKFGERVHVTLTTGITSTTGDPLNRNSSFSFVVGSTPGPETPNFFQSSPINELPVTTDVPRIFDVFDMDVDGDLDMVLASSGDNKLTWYENDGSQVFTEHIVYSLADFAFGVDAEDIDSDGDFDFVLASEADNQFAWFENDGSQNFTRIPISSGTSAFASLIYAADIDGDGDIDLVTGSRVAPSLSWHENNGSQVFTEHVIINSATDITSIVIRDIDGDLDLDIAAAYFFEDVLAWYENDGTQNFTEHVFANGLGNLNALDAGDINGDGTVDFIGVARGAPSVHAFVNDGFQNFSESQISTQLCEQVRAIDLDGDGDQDVILSGTELSWLENDGGGGFSSHTIENALTQMMVHAADMDLDGDLDVVASSWPPSKLAWYENTFAGPVCAVAPTADAGADQLICASDNAVLNGVLGGSASSAIWSTSGSGVFDDSSQITTGYTPSAADITSGSVQLTLTVAAAGPCPQVQDVTVITIAGPITAGNPSVNVAVQQLMVVDVLSASTINNGDQISYTILQNPSKGTTTIGSDNSIRYLANSRTVGSDSFNYRICNQCGSCSDGTVNINIANVAPIFTPPPTPFEAAPGQSIVIPIPSIVTDLNGNIDLTSFSNFNSTANATFSYNSATGDLTIDYTTASFTSAQDNISFRICDHLNSCTDVTVLITLNGQITVHNGISPNNDGLNDFFDIQNIQFIEPINKVTIYNRWGDKVYEQENYNSDDVSHRFDGKRNNGTELPSGIYFYKVEFPSGRSELTGYLTLKK